MREPSLAKPTPEQLLWADSEVGVIIHKDLTTYEDRPEDPAGYRKLSPKLFNPDALDTDQWLRAVSDAGARYAVLVVKHCSGFCLWPTETLDYSVKNSPWRDSRGDVAADFIRSCEKYHIRPGFYYSTSCNDYLSVENPGLVRGGDAQQQKRYNQIMMAQLEEIWSNYGPLFELWFDGGILPASLGGADVGGLLRRLQPNAVCFQGPSTAQSRIRWIGNERGDAPDPCWSTVDEVPADQANIDAPLSGAGNAGGSIWMPGETDMPNRDQHRAYMGGWFWRAGEDDTLYSLEHLLDCYERSVGRGTNLLLGMVIDTHGRVPEADRNRFAEFGAAIRQRYGNPLGETAGEGEELLLTLPREESASAVVLMEDIAQGERVRAYTLEGHMNQGWMALGAGQHIGHKRILRFPRIRLDAVRLRCEQSVGVPLIRSMAVHC